MTKLLTPRLHGYIDYAIVLLFAVAPMLFGFSETPSAICYLLAGVHLLMTLLTAFPLGVVDLIPFTIHGGIEAVVAVGLLALPWLAGFEGEDAARNFFLVSGVAVAITWVLTDYRFAYRLQRRAGRTPSFN